MVGLWRCARGKCVQRVANRIVMVVSRWLWVEISIERGRESKDCERKVMKRSWVSEWVGE